MKFAALFLIVLNFGANAESENPNSHFECREQGGGRYRPFYLQLLNSGEFKNWGDTSKGLLGQNAMASKEECQKAIDAANNEFGAICSRTGLDGWKPTTFTGTSPGRPDFGYLGGSSIMSFESCLKASRLSSRKGICFWGGSDWFVSPIDKEGLTEGPFSSVEECTTHTQE